MPAGAGARKRSGRGPTAAPRAATCHGSDPLSYFFRMPPAAGRTLRYLRTWLTDRAPLETRELVLDRSGTEVPATLTLPAHGRTPLPTWIVLHGITRPGRAHPQLVRFTRALASTGCAVLVPEVPEWRALELAPALTVPTVTAALDAVEDDARSVGLLGFSFGAPQAIAASGHPDVRGRLSGVAGFGGYCDLERTVVYQFTGRHESPEGTHVLRPDPYGRWIVGANYLTAVPGYEDAGRVADGLRSLAAMAGDLSVVSWDPALEPLKREIREGLDERERTLFDVFAPPGSVDPDPEVAEPLAHALAATGRVVDPAMEPATRFADVPGPVHILHGRQDHLIPFSEAARLRAALPRGIDARATVTRLFGHSKRDPLPAWRDLPGEAVRFLRALGGILGVV